MEQEEWLVGMVYDVVNHCAVHNGRIYAEEFDRIGCKYKQMPAKIPSVSDREKRYAYMRMRFQLFQVLNNELRPSGKTLVCRGRHTKFHSAWYKLMDDATAHVRRMADQPAANTRQWKRFIRYTRRALEGPAASALAESLPVANRELFLEHIAADVADDEVRASRNFRFALAIAKVGEAPEELSDIP